MDNCTVWQEGAWQGAAAPVFCTVERDVAEAELRAELTGRASTHLMSLSSELEHQSADLQSEVGKFVESLRAA